MYKLHLEREIAVAHQLHKHKGKCKNLHGHNLKIIVDLETVELIQSGSSQNMIADFGDIKTVIDKYDHQSLNETLNLETPTSEFLATILATEMYSLLLDGGHKGLEISVTVKVQESEGQYVEYSIN